MSQIKEIMVPDIGDTNPVEVIEVLVKSGDVISADDPLITLESEKASMDVPSPMAGKAERVSVKVGDKISQGDLILTILDEKSGSTQEVAPKTQQLESAQSQPMLEIQLVDEPKVKQSLKQEHIPTSQNSHAGPATRRLAYELGVILDKVKGSGRKGRIISSDIKAYVKQTLQKGGASIQGSGLGLNVEPMPEIDFSQFGAIEITKLSRIKKLTAKNMARNWISIPHVTQFDEADVTELENFRNQNKQAALDNGIRLTPLAFILKGVVGALQRYPEFNASISTDGQDLILKKYFHIGVAVNTPNGLVVPVVKNVDKKGIFEIARELSDLSQKSREGKLTREQMQGQSFTISSLGNLGGTGFTPIINAPDVAILGLAKMQTKPVYINKQFEARKMLPLCLSYDHRVIDGAEAAIFTSKIADMLQDIRNMLL